ncbi:50S ribosomal protein L15 [bacterium]|nr:50S ribosomal protein L15 [bacterium]MBU1754190.1 50S ribosomal protein L15 [bacterium]
MKLNELVAPAGSRKKAKRVGRGHGSGLGMTAGKGAKGQKARSGRKPRRGFEGGQMPLQRRIPKRGFFSMNRREFAIINVERLAELESGCVVTSDLLLSLGMISKLKCGVKILGDGEINIPLHVVVEAASKEAVRKIEAAGGTVEISI